jgi:hypothetical protein
MFSTPPEVRTFAALHDVLAPLGYAISQKARVLDCIQAAAANPQATTPVGPTLGDVLVPALREVAGPFGPTHPWLHKGDWSYAFQAHFDFVVHERLAGAHPTHPLFAVEFDGTQTHASAVAQQRDLRKNRLCAASGLPLVRVDDTFLHPPGAALTGCVAGDALGRLSLRDAPPARGARCRGRCDD